MKVPKLRGENGSNDLFWHHASDEKDVGDSSMENRQARSRQSFKLCGLILDKIDGDQIQ